MKRYILYIITLISVVNFYSCSSSDENEQNIIGGKELKFSSNISSYVFHQNNITRVQNNKFENSDKIGVFALAQGENIQNASSQNIEYSLGSGNIFIATDNSTAIKVKLGNPLDIISYYPFQQSLNNYVINLDLSDQKDFSQKDFLYSANLSIKDGSSETKLIFNHELSLLRIKMELGNGVSSFQSFSLQELTGIKLKGAFDLKIGAIQTEDILGKVDNINITKTDNTVNMDILIFPTQNLNDIDITWSLDGESYKFTPSALIAEKGKQYTYRLQVSKDGDILVINPGATIDPREEKDGGSTVINPGGEVSNDEVYSNVNKIKVNYDDESYVLPLLTKSSSITWNISSDVDWVKPEQFIGTGNRDIILNITKNTLPTKREGNIILKTTNSNFTVRIEQDAYENALLEDVVVINESFGDIKNIPIDFSYKEFNNYTGFDSEKCIFSNKGSRLELRGKATVMSGEKHIWFPAFKKKNPYTADNPAPTLNISNIDTEGLIDITISFDMTGDIGSRTIDTDFITIELDGIPIEVPSHTLSNADNNKYYTTTIPVNKTFSEIEFKTDERNFLGIRFDNLIIKGKKINP